MAIIIRIAIAIIIRIAIAIIIRIDISIRYYIKATNYSSQSFLSTPRNTGVPVCVKKECQKQ